MECPVAAATRWTARLVLAQHRLFLNAPESTSLC